MRFTISREKLQEGLTAVTATIPAKTTLPVLANILLETTERGIRLSGTDLDIAVSTEVAADVETAGAITIPDRMRMVATNGHRLAKMELPLASAGAPSENLIVPPKALDQIRRLFPAEEE